MRRVQAGPAFGSLRGDRPPGLAWAGTAAGFALLALVGGLVPRPAIDWQPALAAHQPWRALSAVGVHYSALHLLGNVGGAVLAGWLGWAAQVPGRAALAWLVAWPLTQLGLLLRPDLAHYGGLSGVLHAGVAIVAVWLVAAGSTRRQRAVGLAIGLGLVGKLIGESPWGPALRHTPGWDIATAPFAHLSGIVAGLLSAGLAVRAPRRRGSLGIDRTVP